MEINESGHNFPQRLCKLQPLMEVTHLGGIHGDKYGFGNCSNFPHMSESTPKDFYHMVVHALCAWMTLLFVGVSSESSTRFAHGQLLCSDGLLNNLAHGRAMWISDICNFYHPISCPLVQWSSRGIIWDLMRISVVLTKIFFFFLVRATCHNFVGWPVVSIAFFNMIATCHSLNWWCRFIIPIFGPYI